MSNDLNATAASLLGLLSNRPMTGWELYAAFQESIEHFWSITRSQVYRELRAMAERGFVEIGESGPRERRRCTITAAGLSAFRTWIKRMPGEELIRFPLLLTVFFGAAVPPKLLVAACAQHRETHALRLAAYEATLHHVRAELPYAAHALEFGIAYEGAVMAWIDGLPWMTEGVLVGSEAKSSSPQRKKGRS